MITIEAIPALQDNYIWVLTNKEKQTALVVDPSEAQPVVAFLKSRGLQLKGILITHHHWDHVQGVEELIHNNPLPVYGAANSPFPLIGERLTESQTLFIGEDFPVFQVLSIPGHTLDHLGFYAEDYIFCGDTLFAAGCGRLFEGTAQQMYSSLQKIAALPDNTQIFCAHEYTMANLAFASEVEPENRAIQARIEKVAALRKQDTPSIPSLLSEEKETNPFLRCEKPAIIARIKARRPDLVLDPVSVFSELRTWKNNF